MARAIRKKSRKKLDLSPLAGLLIALCGIVGGLLLEGGRISDVSQFTAALIVLGGTAGAVLITTPLPLFLGAVKKVPALLREGTEPVEQTILQLLSFASHARHCLPYTGPSSPSSTAHSSQMVMPFSLRYRVFVSPFRNHKSSWTMAENASFLVVTAGKAWPRSKRSWRPKRVEVLTGEPL